MHCGIYAKNCGAAAVVRRAPAAHVGEDLVRTAISSLPSPVGSPLALAGKLAVVK
jgi:hypothetical protein